MSFNVLIVLGITQLSIDVEGSMLAVDHSVMMGFIAVVVYIQAVL